MCTFEAITILLPLIRDGKVRALAITSRERTPLASDMPTMIEAGVPDYEVSTFYGVVAPAGTPPEIVAKLNAAINEGFAAEDMRAAISKLNTYHELVAGMLTCGSVVTLGCLAPDGNAVRSNAQVGGILMRVIFQCFALIAFLACVVAVGLADDEPRQVVKGWGEVTDYYYDSKISLDGDTLVMTGPGDYADNYINGKTTAPRVMQKVSGDFSVEVKVAHVDRAKAGTVFERLDGFPTAFHSGTLLIRHDQNNFVRFERESMNTNGSERFVCRAPHLQRRPAPRDGKHRNQRRAAQPATRTTRQETAFVVQP